jgi:hypothetical protein
LTGSGLAAAACAGCCLVPLLWPAVAAALGGSLFAWFERSQSYLTATALVVVGLAGLHGIRVWRRTGRYSVAHGALLVAAIGLSLLSALWSHLEPFVLRIVVHR